MTSSTQPIVAVVNELLGVGAGPGDQLSSYGCDAGATGTGTHASYAPRVLKNAPIG